MFFSRDVDELKSPEGSSEVGKNHHTYEKSLKRMELFSKKK